MDNKKIRDLALKETFIGFCVVRKKEIREKQTGGDFASLDLADASGHITAKLWELDRFAREELEEGMVVKVQATVKEYNGKAELHINRMRLALEDEFQIEDILAHSDQPRETRLARIMALTDKIQNSYIRALADSFWNDQEFLEAFLRAPAGKQWHHAYIGGLSEHSANIGELALRIAQGYDFLNKDYLIFGGLFHDAGKIRSYTADMRIDFTDEGRLIDHICICDHWVAQRAGSIENFPDQLLVKLRHMILSHQGEKAYASPVVPMMPEALVLYYCDEIDSKMGAMQRLRQKQKGPGWTDYVKLLERYLYFHDDFEGKS
jgi:3'-5' exoribonuclease